MKHKWHLLQSRNECFTLLDKASDMNQILRGKTAHQNKVSKAYVSLGTFLDYIILILDL